MATRTFTRVTEIGPVNVEANADDTIDWPGTSGGGSVETVALAAAGIDTGPGSTPITSFGFSAPHLAAATKARISAVGGANGYLYVDGAGGDISLAHPIASGETITLEGNANINGLYFYGSSTIVITLEGPAA